MITFIIYEINHAEGSLSPLFSRDAFFKSEHLFLMADIHTIGDGPRGAMSGCFSVYRPEEESGT